MKSNRDFAIFGNISISKTICLILLMGNIERSASGPVESQHFLKRIRRSAQVNNAWTRNYPYGIVFVYSNEFSQTEASNLVSAAQEILQFSCINVQIYSYRKFILSGGSSNPLFRNYVYITRDSYKGCSAIIGMNGGMQRMNLDPVERCPDKKSAIIHEMVHSLGFDHEQNRPDRDQFVQINFENVMAGLEDNFRIKRFATAVGPYDYSSIMQYGAYSFAINNYSPTISSKLPGFRVPHDPPSELSPIDKKKIKYITGCNISF